MQTYLERLYCISAEHDTVLVLNMIYDWLIWYCIITAGAHTLATHVLQFVFLGYTQFKWPVAYYTTTEAQASELMVLVWKVINTLSAYGFEVRR